MSLGPAVDARLSTAIRRGSLGRWLLGIALVASQCGCTALVSTTTWRDAMRLAGAATDADAGETVAADETSEPVDALAAAEAAAEPLVLVKPAASSEETIDDAIDRLAAAGRLDDATQAALISMLENAPQQDWPEIIDAFIDALDSNHVAAKPVAPASAPAEEAAAAASPSALIIPVVDRPAATPAAAAAAPVIDPPLLFPVAEPPAPLVVPTAAVAPLADAEPVEAAAVTSAPEPAQPDLVVVNACFVTRVRGWGAVDRFETSRFRAGQDLIVYFELDNLESRETAAGHTTRIDTALRLVADDGRTIHDWSFEPLEETCPARRRDYFARYVLRLPADMPTGDCRLEVAVTDTIGDRTASTTLPLEIANR